MYIHAWVLRRIECTGTELGFPGADEKCADLVDMVYRARACARARALSVLKVELQLMLCRLRQELADISNGGSNPGNCLLRHRSRPYLLDLGHVGWIYLLMEASSSLSLSLSPSICSAVLRTYKGEVPFLASQFRQQRPPPLPLLVRYPPPPPPPPPPP